MTSIQGFVETLQDEEKNKDKKHYLSIIHRNTLRLNNLVKDLMLLSKVEDEKEQESVILDINDVMLSTLKMYEKTSSHSNIEVEFNSEK